MPVSPGTFNFFAKKDRGALKLTIHQFYRVNGDSTQNRGVQSDIVLPSLIDHMDLGESFMDNALEFDRVEPAKYTANDFITPEILSALRTASQARIAANADFQKELKDIDRFLARKNRKSVSLNEEVRRKEREEDKRESEEKKKEGEESDPESELLEEESTTGPIFKQDYYTDEVLAVAIDYANQLKGLVTAKK
jgi:carboxyl-terminal processing protease